MQAKIINRIYYDSVFNIIIDLKEEEIKVHIAFDILFNLMESPIHRKKLAEERYLARLFEKYMVFAERLYDIENGITKVPEKKIERKKSDKDLKKIKRKKSLKRQRSS
jgi:hypothetical protein